MSNSGSELPFYVATNKELAEDQGIIASLFTKATLRNNPSISFCEPEILDYFRSKFFLDRSSVQVQSTAFLNLCINREKNPKHWNSKNVDKLTEDDLDSLFIQQKDKNNSRDGDEDHPLTSSRLQASGVYEHPLEEEYQKNRMYTLAKGGPQSDIGLKLNELRYLERLVDDSGISLSPQCKNSLKQTYQHLETGLASPDKTDYKKITYEHIRQYRTCIQESLRQ